MKKAFFYLFSVSILIQVSWRKLDQPNKWIISSSSSLRAIWSVITINGHSSHFLNVTESLLYITYQHTPTEVSLSTSSCGVLCCRHADCNLRQCDTWRRMHWTGTWTLPERRIGHPLPWEVSTWTLGPSEQWHWATPPCMVARTCTWQRCPVGVLFSKWRSHSFVIKMIIAVKCCVKCKRLT